MQGGYFYTLLVSFAFGIIAQDFFSFSGNEFLFLFVLAFAVLLYAPLGERRSHILFVAIVLLLFALGAGRLALFERTQGNALFDEHVGGQVSFEGVIVAEPDVRENTTRLVVHADVLHVGTSTQAVDTKVLITASHYPEYMYGDRLFVSGMLQVPESFESENGRIFNYPKFLAKSGIFYTMFLPDSEKVGEGEGNVILAPLLIFKHAVIENVSRIIPEPHASLAGGLVFGAKSSLGEELLEAFRRTGIIHIVVLSGYNVTIVAEALMYAFAFLPRVARIGVGSGAIVLFALMTGAGATIVRASIMALFVILARVLGRRADMTRFLFFAGALMLVHNPAILMHDPSFQLSFLATFGLLHVSPRLERYFTWVTKHLGFREFLLATLATQIFVLPALLYMTGQVSIVAVFVNLLVLPAVPLTMLFGFLTGMIGFVSATLSWIPGFLAFFLLAYEITVVELFSALPFASINLPLVPFSLVVVLYAVLLLLLLYWKPATERKTTNGMNTSSYR